MMLTLSELREGRADRTYTLCLSLDPIEFQGEVFYPVTPPEFTLELHSDGNSVKVSGKMCALLGAQCARCLVATNLKLCIPNSDTWPLFPEGEEGEEFFASSFVSENGEYLDLNEYARESLLEHLPFRVLCKADCKGLCFTCGEDLNQAQCVCGKQNIDPRLAVLGRLLDNKGGVRDGGS